jgi:transcriptional regulator with XRE-family HTH domain
MDEDRLAKRVGQAIARQRRLARWTQAQVAEKLGIEVETVSRMETGTRPASLTRLEQLSELLCCPVIRFFQEEGEDETQILLQTLADILGTMRPEAKSLLVNFMSDAARLFKNN